MGIKHFFAWYRKTFPETITTHPKSRPLDVDIDTLGLDLNGIFHPCAQKVFQYGKYKPASSILSRQKLPYEKLERQFCEEVCREIESLVQYVRPKKRLFLCVDGVAGSSKMSAQRSRRFKSACENSECMFDSCSLTPGTELMDTLTAHIDYYIRTRIIGSSYWKNLDIVFSSEKSPGEGEHTIKNLIKQTGSDKEKYCIFGLDADIIMLSLATRRPRIYVLRDNIYVNNERFLIDVGQLHRRLNGFLGTSSAVPDFILVCFLMGNDFLPNIPSLEIITGGIETVMFVYKSTCSPNGIVTKSNRIRFRSLLKFFNGCSSTEIESLFKKFRHREKYFPDPLLTAHFRERVDILDIDNTPTIECDFDSYRQQYYEKHFPAGTSVKEICHAYLYGMQWIIDYYMKSIPSWTWCYPYLYAPFLCDLAEHCSDMPDVKYPSSCPATPFQQLLTVIPPQSVNLLPTVLQPLITSSTSPITQYYPKNFEVDISGKRQEWEGIVKIPIVDPKIIEHIYNSSIHSLGEKDKRRNTTTKDVRYVYDSNRSFCFRSKHGIIRECQVYTEYIN